MIRSGQGRPLDELAGGAAAVPRGSVVDDAESLGEEIANAVTHGLGAGLALAGFLLLLVLATIHGTALHIAALGLYGATLVTLYAASTLYHAWIGPRVKKALLAFDHAAIFLLIAGTYTPFTLISLGGAWGWGLFVAVWTLAVAGILFRVFSRHHSHRFLVPIYLAMGWLAVIAGGEVWGALGAGGTAWLVIGGLAYTGGVAFYRWRRLPYNHAVWHVFVLAGSICHFCAIAFHVLPSV